MSRQRSKRGVQMPQWLARRPRCRCAGDVRFLHACCDRRSRPQTKFRTLTGAQARAVDAARGLAGRARERVAAASTPAAAGATGSIDGSLWVPALDPASGLFYYVNSASGESTVCCRAPNRTRRHSDAGLAVGCAAGCGAGPRCRDDGGRAV